ncbi:MAG: helix-turn-helix domain-containing protein [Blastocatellales bacterium]
MSLEELAQMVGLSETRLRALFKSNLGLTPTQYIRKIKMDEAANLLRNTYWRVARIAARLGASGDSRFARDFRKVHGMTPTGYRKLHQRQGEGEGVAEGSAPP